MYMQLVCQLKRTPQKKQNLLSKVTLRAYPFYPKIDTNTAQIVKITILGTKSLKKKDISG